MQTRLRTTIVLLVLAGAIGIWLAVAPVVAEYQAIGDPWITATTHHLATGALLAATSLITALAIIGTAPRALTSSAEVEADHRADRPVFEPASRS